MKEGTARSSSLPLKGGAPRGCKCELCSSSSRKLTLLSALLCHRWRHTNTNRGRNEVAEAADRERFLQELEEDAEMRARIALFKDPAAAAAAAGAGPAGMVEDEDDSEDYGDLPQVCLCIVYERAALRLVWWLLLCCRMRCDTLTAPPPTQPNALRCRWMSCWTTWRASAWAAARKRRGPRRRMQRWTTDRGVGCRPAESVAAQRNECTSAAAQSAKAARELVAARCNPEQHMQAPQPG